MPRLIKGKNLNREQKEEVCRAFVHRPKNDEQWFIDNAFWFLNDGSRLTMSHKRCEPAFLATTN